MKKFEFFISKIPWAPVGVLVALAFGFFGVYSWLHERKPNISYEIINETNVLDVRKPLEDLSIFFQEENIQERNLNLRIFTIKVENNGEVDILQNYYDRDDIWGLQVSNARIIEVRLIDTNDDYLKSKLEPRLIERDKIELNKVIFEKDKFFVLEILGLHSKAVQPEITPMGKIAGIEKKIPIKSWIKEEKLSFVSQVFSGNVLIHFIRLIVYLLDFTIIAVIVGFSISKLSSVIHKRKRKIREREIKIAFGKKALEENGEMKEIFSFYIANGEDSVRWLNKLLEKEDILALDIQGYDLREKYEHIAEPELAILPPPYDRRDIRRGFFFSSHVEKLIETGTVKLGEDDRVMIDKDFKQALNRLIEYLEVVKSGEK